MNLAWKDIRFNPTRFVLTVFGVAMLMTAVIGMTGLYRGIVGDALLIVDRIGADLWVVQGERSGPFAEGSAIPSTMDRRVEGVPGVRSVRRFTQFNYQFVFAGQEHRATITGVDFPRDDGSWIVLTAGRQVGAARYEAVADVSTGLALGDDVRLGLDVFRIVGVTEGMVDAGGDGLLFVSINDAIAIGQRRTSEEVLLARAANGLTQSRQGAGSSVAQDSKIAAVLVTLDPAANLEAVMNSIRRWGDANVLSAADQRDLLLNARLWKLRLQILAFTILILVITCIVVSLIIYTMTIEKLHQIAMLKLIGARNTVIASMIGQQAGMIGIVGFGLAIAISSMLFRLFPRRIVIDPADLAMLSVALAVICGIGSWVGIVRALKINAREVLS